MGSLDFIRCDDQPALYIQADMPLEVRVRQGGEQAKLPGRPTRPLKKLLQEWAVPPWLRDRIPLIYQADVLLAIGDWYTLENAPVTGQGQAMKVVWKHPDLHCGS